MLHIVVLENVTKVVLEKSGMKLTVESGADPEKNLTGFQLPAINHYEYIYYMVIFSF